MSLHVPWCLPCVPNAVAQVAKSMEVRVCLDDHFFRYKVLDREATGVHPLCGRVAMVLVALCVAMGCRVARHGQSRMGLTNCLDKVKL